MKVSGILCAIFIISLSSCNKKEEKNPVISDLLIDDFDFTKDAVFDTLNVPQHLRKVVKNISTVNVYETGVQGKGPAVYTNFENFKKLSASASEKELLALTDNKNNTVAVYAAVGLLDKNKQYTVSVFQKMLRRKGIVHIEDGCLLGDDHPTEPIYWKHYYQLKQEELKSDSDLKQLDSLLLFMPASSELILTTALRNRTYSDGLKKQIAKQAFENHRTPALLYLNSWHKKEYSEPIQEEFLKLIKNDSIDDGHKRKYLSMLLSFNNMENKKAVLNYIKKDSLWKEEGQIISQLEHTGITSKDYN